MDGHGNACDRAAEARRRARVLVEDAAALIAEAREVVAACRNTQNVLVLQRTLARVIAKARSSEP